jgi:TolB-like protein/Flp pilus assembly protein TadD
MATGRRPFAGGGLAELASAILRDQPVPISVVRPDFPPPLGRMMARCLEKDPAARIQTAAEVRDQLGSIRDAIAGAPTSRAAAGGVPSADALRDEPRQIRAIAVLPLTDLAHDPSQAFFADGMTEALITDLARLGRVRVISRTSVMRFKDTLTPLPDIARALGVDAIVEGSVLRVADRVRITAQLVRGDSEEHLWAERYERRLEDILTLQEEVAQAIAHEVDRVLGRPGGPPVGERRKVDPDVYLLDLQGRHHWNTRTERGSLAAVHCFRQAIDRDPTYGPAYVGLADAYGMLANYGIEKPRDIHAKALAAAERALTLDPESAEVHRILAFVRWQFEFDWESAAGEYERALALEPNSALTTYWYGVFLGVVGQHHRGVALLRRAGELDPLSLLIPAAQGWLHYFARQYGAALPYYRRVLEVDPDHYVTLWFLGETLVELGEYAEGIGALERSLELSGRISRLFGYLGYAYGRAGRGEEARGALAELEARRRERYVPPYFSALVLSGLRDVEGTLARLEQAWSERDTMIRDLRADSQWDWLHDQPRFQRLLERMRLVL